MQKRDGPQDPATISWRAVAESMPTIVAEVAPDGRCVYVNHNLLTYMGASHHAVVEFGWKDLVHPDDLDGTVRRLAQGFAAEQPFEHILRARRADGSYGMYQGVTWPLRDAHQRIDRWIVIMQDIERSVEVTNLLLESEWRLHQFLETLPLIVWTADPSGWIDWYNSRWYEFTGQTATEAAGWGWQAAHHPEDFLRVMEEWPHSIATGAPFEMEFRLRDRDGEYRWFLTRIVPLRNGKGDIIRWYGTNVDIQQQKRNEQRANRIAQTLQEAFLPLSLAHHSDFRFDAVYLAAESEALIGGDWYDATPLGGDCILITCGDVAGHGVDAAVAAGRTRQAITFAASEDPDPSKVLSRVNRLLVLQKAPMTCALVAIFEIHSMELQYALAGHPPPIFAFPGQAPYVAANGGPPLTVVDDLEVKTHRVKLCRDAVAVFYTDGFVEFGREIESAQQQLLRAADELVGNVHVSHPARVIQHAVIGGAAPRDDAVLVVLQCSNVSGAFLELDVGQLIKKWRFHSSDALSAHNSRHELVHFLKLFAVDSEQTFVAELILGEMLANTVEHAPGLVEITLDWTASEPVATIRDAGPGIGAFEPALPATEWEEHGRGLFLINAFSGYVTVRRAPTGGTEFTVRLPLRRREFETAPLNRASV